MFLFPTIATRDRRSGFWLIDIHGWICKENTETKIGRAIRNGLRKRLELQPTDSPSIFMERSAGFAVENRRAVRPRIRLAGVEHAAKKSKRNGHFKFVVKLPPEAVVPCLSQTLHGSQVLPIEVAIDDGDSVLSTVCHVLPANGLSVISDLDDTIKASNVLDKKELLKNTFLRDFETVEGMSELFKHLAVAGNTFHYVSATPWQLFPHIEFFLTENGFPAGSIHLRKFTLKDITVLKKLAPSHKGKRKTIENLLHRCPERHVILFGDSGERDPEMYGDIARKYPNQVNHIFIRNVTAEPFGHARWSRAFTQITPEKVSVFEESREIDDQIAHIVDAANTEKTEE